MRAFSKIKSLINYISINYISNLKLLILGIVLICIGIGLVIADTPSCRDCLDTCWYYLNIKEILWPWGAIVCLGGPIAGLVVGLVSVAIFKPKISWWWIAITVYIGVMIVGLGIGIGIGLAITDILFFKKKIIKEILWPGIIILWIGGMIGWYAVLKERMIGMASVGVAIVGLILADLSGDDSIKAVRNVATGLGSVAENLGSVSTKLDSGLGSVSTELDSGLDSVSTKLDSGLGSVSTELDSGLGSVSTKLASVSTKLDSGLGSVSTELDSGLDSVSTKLDSGLGSVSTKLDSGLREIAEKIKNYQSDPDSQIVKDLEFQIECLTQSLESQKTTIESIKKDLDEAIQAQNSVRLLIGSEDSLTTIGFLNTDRSVSSFFLKKSYNLSKKLSDDDPLVTIVPIGKPVYIEKLAPQKLKLIGGSGQLDLKRLVSHSGTLKKKKDYTVKSDSIITFINPLLGRMDILAVVERQ